MHLLILPLEQFSIRAMNVLFSSELKEILSIILLCHSNRFKKATENKIKVTCDNGIHHVIELHGLQHLT